ncbi:MAG: DUF3842 family protein [Ruminococcaceae bacterium]|nr:DUF3842 family protein [Oscillospiraceae bacterium]
MNILLIDGQGGKMGRRLAEEITARFPEQTLTVVGTNSVATSAMLKGGASQGATGENAVIVCSRRADVIVGPIGIVIADSMLGEITPKMALAVAQSDAVKILIPANRCNHLVAGMKGQSLSELMEDTLEKIAELAKGY